MTTETVVMLSGGDDPDARRNLEDFAVTLCDQAKKHGCRACAVWTDDALKVRIQEGCGASVQDLFLWLGESAAEQGASITIGQDQESGPCIRDIEDGPIPWGTVLHARLTRDLLCALPEGAFVASDRACSIGRLGPSHVRAQQWQRAQLAGLDGAMFRVLWSEEDFQAFCKRSSAQASY
ncbi:MAG TPA: hypothetical protein VF551_02465 [Chthoniobacterales bacterium]